MKSKLLSLPVNVARQAHRAVHISTKQKDAQTRAMLDRMIRCVV